MSKIRSAPVTVGPVTAAFPSLFQTSAPKNTSAEPKYNVTCIITAEQYNQLVPVMQQVAGAFTNGEANQPDFDWGIRPCSSKSEHYSEKAVSEGMYYFNAKASEQYKPRVVDRNHQDILDPGIIRDGAQLYVSITLWDFASGNNKGIGLGLGPVMYVGDGEVLNIGGGISVASAFAGIQLPPAQATAAVPGAPNVGMDQGMVPGAAVPGAAVPGAAPAQGIPAFNIPQQQF